MRHLLGIFCKSSGKNNDETLYAEARIIDNKYGIVHIGKSYIKEKLGELPRQLILMLPGHDLFIIDLVNGKISLTYPPEKARKYLENIRIIVKNGVFEGTVLLEKDIDMDKSTVRVIIENSEHICFIDIVYPNAEPSVNTLMHNYYRVLISDMYLDKIIAENGIILKLGEEDKYYLDKIYEQLDQRSRITMLTNLFIAAKMLRDTDTKSVFKLINNLLEKPQTDIRFLLALRGSLKNAVNTIKNYVNNNDKCFVNARLGTRLYYVKQLIEYLYGQIIYLTNIINKNRRNYRVLYTKYVLIPLSLILLIIFIATINTPLFNILNMYLNISLIMFLIFFIPIFSLHMRYSVDIINSDPKLIQLLDYIDVNNFSLFLVLTFIPNIIKLLYYMVYGNNIASETVTIPVFSEAAIGKSIALLFTVLIILILFSIVSIETDKVFDNILRYRNYIVEKTTLLLTIIVVLAVISNLPLMDPYVAPSIFAVILVIDAYILKKLRYRYTVPTCRVIAETPGSNKLRILDYICSIRDKPVNPKDFTKNIEKLITEAPAIEKGKSRKLTHMLMSRDRGDREKAIKHICRFNNINKYGLVLVTVINDYVDLKLEDKTAVEIINACIDNYYKTFPDIIICE